MPRFQVAIQKVLGTEYWVNDYLVEAAGPGDVPPLALQIVALERAVHHNDVGFVNYRVRQDSDAAPAGTVYPLGLAGQGGAYIYLSLFNVARIDMGQQFGRPGRKYLRLPVPTGSVNNGRWSAQSLTNINSDYCNPLIALGFVVSPQNMPYISASLNPTVGMRQLRRGAKRRLQPIIPIA